MLNDQVDVHRLRHLLHRKTAAVSAVFWAPEGRAILLGIVAFFISVSGIDAGLWASDKLIGRAFGAFQLALQGSYWPTLTVFLGVLGAGDSFENSAHAALYVCEYAFLAWAKRRTDLITSDLLFWLVIGGPLSFLICRHFGGMQLEATFAMVSRQILGGVFCVGLGSLLAVFLRVAMPSSQAFPKMSLAQGFSQGLTGLIVVPATLFFLTIDHRSARISLEHEQEEVALLTALVAENLRHGEGVRVLQSLKAEGHDWLQLLYDEPTTIFLQRGAAKPQELFCSPNCRESPRLESGMAQAGAGEKFGEAELTTSHLFSLFGGTDGNPITKFVVPVGPAENLIVLRDLSELWKTHLKSSLRALASLTALIIIAGYLSRNLLRYLASDSRILQEISSPNKIPSMQYSMHTEEAQETSVNLLKLRELMESYASDSRLSRDIIKDISSFIPIILLMYEKTKSASTPKLLFSSNDAPFGMLEIATRPHRIVKRIHPRDRAALTSALRQLRRQGVCAVDFRVHMPTGEWCFLNMRLVRSEVKEGLLRYSVMLADRNAWYLDGGTSSNGGIALLGRMSAGLAHELNQPLNVISLAVDAVEARCEMTDGTEFSNYVAQRLARIREQNDRASEIIKTVGSLARLTPGVLVDSDARDSIRRAVEICSPELRRCRIDLDLTLASQADRFVVHVDPDGLCRVIVNLILNAIDAIHDEGNEDRGLIRISISAWPDIGQISIDVTDNGPGFEPHALENLFVPFFTLKQPGRGAGLGLASSYAAVKNWGGEITAKNLQRGAQVSVYLPDRRSSAAGDVGGAGAGCRGEQPALTVLIAPDG